MREAAYYSLQQPYSGMILTAKDFFGGQTIIGPIYKCSFLTNQRFMFLCMIDLQILKLYLELVNFMLLFLYQETIRASKSKGYLQWIMILSRNYRFNFITNLNQFCDISVIFTVLKYVINKPYQLFKTTFCYSIIPRYIYVQISSKCNVSEIIE